MLERKKILVERVIHIVSDWLKDERTFTSPLVRCRHGRSGEGKLFINVTRISSGSLLIQEGYALADGDNRIHRNWSFLKEGRWDVAGLEKNGRPVVIRHLQKELDDLLGRLEVIGQVVCPIGYSYDEDMEDIGLDLVVPAELRPEGKAAKSYRRFVSWDGWRSPVFYAVAALMLFLFVSSGLIFVNIYSSNRSHKYLVDMSMSSTRKMYEDNQKLLAGIISDLDKSRAEYDAVIARMDREREIFLQNSYALVLQMERDLPSYHPLRKRAYRLIADNIGESSTNGEILFELNRLPKTEFAASMFLETNNDSVVTLSSYTPAISSLIYPVEIPNQPNDGKGFRITSGYMAKRVDPLGTGGTHPHHAVDIINVSNIRRIDKDGKLDREGMPNGDVVAVDSGVVTAAYSNPIYGYLIEIRHKVNPEIRERFPAATGWRTFYAHLDGPATFKIGDQVEVGDKIGEIGNSGTSTGPHLHFEIRLDYTDKEGARIGKRINPYPGSEEVDYF